MIFQLDQSIYYRASKNKAEENNYWERFSGQFSSFLEMLQSSLIVVTPKLSPEHRATFLRHSTTWNIIYYNNI